VISINKAYERAFQVRREDLEGKKCHEILHHRDRPCFEVGEECPYALSTQGSRWKPVCR
jgi:PAS domain-containing protein